jgi:hypothetical protein
MSRGQLSRTPDNFPRMKHRAVGRLAKSFDKRFACTCEPYWQDAGGGYTELLAEPDPDCPVHFPGADDSDWICEHTRPDLFGKP